MVQATVRTKWKVRVIQEATYDESTIQSHMDVKSKLLCSETILTIIFGGSDFVRLTLTHICGTCVYPVKMNIYHLKTSRNSGHPLIPNLLLSTSQFLLT